MGSSCKTCGLPLELCACSDIAREETTSIRVYIEKRKWGREVTVIDGLSKDIDLRSLSKRLKKSLATGGTTKDGRIELQGNFLRMIAPILIDEGFPETSIELRD
ncbi:MAG: stress response translation initiation inhibitor YciH [Candidatus Heimdallarchaeota archaeon]|nr:MAG: stress response translation initiation inhibitor YciH [Candidatus Heimdallarchaeota archaeon]